MQRLVRRLETIPMALDTVKRAAPRDCRVVLYDGMPISRNRLFTKGVNSVIVLYLMHNDAGRATGEVGHFACILRPLGNKGWRYFSSYGLPPEAELHATHSKGKLLNLLGPNPDWSRSPLQEKRNSATCGLWALARAYFQHLGNSEFAAMMNSRFHATTPDDMVSLMTLLLVHSELGNA